MTPTREDIELYVSGNYDGDAAALEKAIEADPALAQILADEAGLEMLLHGAAKAATFCPACAELVPDPRCSTCGAAIAPGGYRVERVLVSNAHGRMYVARDLDGRRVALKELAFVHAPSVAATAAFEHESTLLRALEHPAIPKFVASFEEGEGVQARYYLAQELVEGTPLDKRLEQRFYREDEVVAIARSVLEVLVYLQSLSPMVIHRDVKPANLIERTDGTLALVDFGAAHVTGHTMGSTTIGTFGYMPVEQLAGVVDATTDVYALAASVVHLLTRQEPWKLVQAEVVLNVSSPLRRWVARATHADPKQRFGDAKAALSALDAPARTRRLPRVRTLVVAAAACALGGGGFAAVHALRGQEADLDANASLAVYIGANRVAQVDVDGKRLGDNVHDNERIAVHPGVRRVSIHLDRGTECEQFMLVERNTTNHVECRDQGAPPFDPERTLPHGPVLDLAYKAAPIRDVVRDIAGRCGWSVLIPDTLAANVTVTLAQVPCDQALETLLESYGLWYEYYSLGKLLRIAPRHELDREVEDRRMRKALRHELGITDDLLPITTKVDLDFKSAPLRGVLQMLADSEHVNFVMPDTIHGDTFSVKLVGVPWFIAMQQLLASEGLGYRYRETGRILRVASQHELDREDEDELARRRPR